MDNLVANKAQSNLPFFGHNGWGDCTEATNSGIAHRPPAQLADKQSQAIGDVPVPRHEV